MWRQVLRWLAPLLVAGICCLPSAYAQRYNVPSEPEGGRTPALPYTVAFASTLLLLVILCTPSRKQ
ncbi:MAG TPA: hypothetical protein VKU02_30880 [Gemmataceae bacterium]|nr:hypothetical protein [Gemmataceae bacterium]